jgi:small subunit ribosomal protein S16
MAVKLRLTRVGSKKNPIYRVVAADSRSPRDGKFIEIVGRYNPRSEPSLIDLDEAKVRGWLEKGAQPTESVARLLKEVEEEDGTLLLRLHVAEGDIGKVIGRQGRLARALRTIVRAGGVEAGRRLQLEIVD